MIYEWVDIESPWITRALHRWRGRIFLLLNNTTSYISGVIWWERARESLISISTLMNICIVKNPKKLYIFVLIRSFTISWSSISNPDEPTKSNRLCLIVYINSEVAWYIILCVWLTNLCPGSMVHAWWW